MVRWVRVRIRMCLKLKAIKICWRFNPAPWEHTNKTQGRKQEESSTNQSRIFCVRFDVVFPAQLRIGQSFIRMVQNCFNYHPKPHENNWKIWKQSILLHSGNEFRHANDVITSCKNRDDAKRINVMKLTSDIFFEQPHDTTRNIMKQHEKVWDHMMIFLPTTLYHLLTSHLFRVNFVSYFKWLWWICSNDASNAVGDTVGKPSRRVAPMSSSPGKVITAPGVTPV